ncbi:MAG: group 1 truncated hemoglobin [Phycisphaerae bacterium]|jgi:hemoglobin
MRTRKGYALSFGLLAIVGLSLTAATAARLHPQEPKPAAKPAAPPATTETLYKRLGGYDALAAVTDDFLGRLLKDPSLGRFFVGHSEDSRKRIRQLIVDQLCAVTGGPCVYIGRDTKTSHRGLGITEADWTATVNHLVATLDKFQVPAREKDEVLALLTTLKPDIVEKP